MKQVLVDCDGASVPTTQLGLEAPLRSSLNHQGPEANVNLRIQSPSNTLLTRVDARAADLVRIASYVYAADQSVSRGGEADVHGDDWKRQFTLYIPVSEPEFWNEESVSKALGETLTFASDDTWNFHFTRALPEQGQLTFELDPNSVLGNPDSLYLFSGGLDSLCAVLEAAVQGKRPLLISHSPAFNIRSRQNQLAQTLRERFKGCWIFPLMSVPIHLTGSEARDYTQRTRSFLFASLGTVFAQRLGLPEVCLADNGVVSLNLPINGQVIGARATRSTHPKFIRLFNGLTQQVFPGGPRVVNPLWDRTRAEGLGVLQDINAMELIQETCSCSHPRYLTRMQSHCGVCSQCIDRRFATLAAGLEEYDPPGGYRIDILRQGLSQVRDQTMALSYTRFAAEVEDLDEIELFLRFSELSECIDPNDSNCGRIAERLVALLKRHAGSIMRVVEEQIALAKGELARASLPPNCLIRLIAGPSEVRGQRGMVERLEPVVPVVTLSAEEELECQRHRFKGNFPVQVTGVPENRRSNEVRVGGAPVILPDAEFLLFLRLVVALYETENGFVPRGNRKGGGLVDEGIYPPDSVDQTVNRLRSRLGPALQGMDAKQYVEVQRKQIRLSTHRRSVIVDRACLLQHQDARIRWLAERLPDY